MKRKWKILVPVIIVGLAFLVTWQQQKEIKAMGNIINSIPLIDSITVKDVKTKEEVMTVTNSETFFPEMVDVYQLSYYDLKWSERKLLKKEPFIAVEYLKENEIQYTLSIYEVDDEHFSLLPSDVSTEVRSYSFSYSPEGNAAYIFAIEEINQLVGVNEGLKELLNNIINVE